MLFACNAAWADKIGDFTATWPSETTNFGSPDVSAVRGKKSGWSRLGGVDGMREFSRPKNLYVGMS
jgi:hypothetical protein